jgi:hypothetical protein
VAGPTLPEWVLAGTLSLLPVFAVPLSILAGAFTERYILACVAGVAILLAFALCQCLKGDRFVGAILTLTFLGWFVAKNGFEVKTQMTANGELEPSTLPIATTPAFWFAELQYYGSERVRPRIYYLADEQMALRHGGMATLETALLQFRRALPLAVVDFREFISHNHRFLVCSGSGPGGWLIPALLAGGAHIRLLASSGDNSVFEVIMP